MIKLVIFDLDGVLVDTKEFHYIALNNAISAVCGSEYAITRAEHISTFDGLPTNKKLQLLSEKKGMDEKHHTKIWEEKQKITFSILKDNITKNDNIFETIQYLKDSGLKVYVASNSIRETIDICIEALGISELIDGVYCNTDVDYPKPNGQIYLQIIAKEGVSPKETLIAEDSSIGREAVFNSCANLLPVNSPNDICRSFLAKKIKQIEGYRMTKKWTDEKLNVLIPMAGAGSRFANAGYTFPKPLIEVMGKPMIHSVVESLGIEAQYIYIVRPEHYEKYNMKYLLDYITPGCKILFDTKFNGAACATLIARELIDNDNPLLIANSDQIIEWNSLEFMYSNNVTGVDGSILTFNSTHPKWSYVKLDEMKNVTEVAEKKVISNIATVGIYYWKKGSEYVKYTDQMIEKEIKVNGEYYVAPVYNEAILDGKKIKTYDVDKMWAVGTPEDLNEYLNHSRDS